MQFEYDPVKLIEEIKKREGIWNVDHVDYRTRKTRARQWQQVVDTLTRANNLQMTKSEMRELGVQLQKKWKSIRDCYQKCLINPKKFNRPYIYASRLEFLAKGKYIPKIKENASDSDDCKPRNVWVTKQKKIRIQKVEDDSDDYNQSEPEMDTTEYPVELEAKNNTDGINSGSFAFANVADPSFKNDTECAEKMFLMSLLPHLKSIPEEFRLNVKLELMQVLRAANESTSKLRYLDRKP